MSKTHEFVNEHLLNKCPPDIEPNIWAAFLSQMQGANKQEVLSHPVQIDVELNSGCNMKCPFCLHGYEKITNANMSVEQYKKIIDEAVKLGVKSLKLNYINEPMLRKDLEECIAYARKAGILNIYMVTNGSLLTESRRKSIIESGITKIFISIDATTEETYNKQRLNGKFKAIVSNVVKLIELRNKMGLEFPIVRVSFLKNTLNIHEASAFKDFWSNKADLIAFQKMDEVPDMDTGLTIVPKEVQTDGCTFPFKQVVVDTYGVILPCCKLPGKKLKLGNIKDMSLSNAWNSSKMVELRRIHANGEWVDHPVCYNCITNKEFNPNSVEKKIIIQRKLQKV